MSRSHGSSAAWAWTGGWSRRRFCRGGREAHATLGAAEGKPEYLKKIPPALNGLYTLIHQKKLSLGLPALETWLRQVPAAVAERQ